MPAGDLGAGIGHIGRGSPRQLGHIAHNAAVGDLSADGAGDVGRPRGHRGYGVWRQRGTVAGRHAAESPAHEAYAAARAHPAPAVHHGIADKAVGPVSVHEAGQDPAGGDTAGRSGSSSTGAAPRSPSEYGSGIPASASGEAGQHPGSHQHLHTHTAARLGHRQAKCRQIAVAFLGDLQQRQGTEEP